VVEVNKAKIIKTTSLILYCIKNKFCDNNCKPYDMHTD